MSTYFPLTQPALKSGLSVTLTVARNWEVFVRPRSGKEGETVTVYAEGKDGAAVLPQPLTTGRSGLIGEGGHFGWVKGSDLPVDIWGRPKGSSGDWQVVPEGDAAVVAGGTTALTNESVETKHLKKEGVTKEKLAPSVQAFLEGVTQAESYGAKSGSDCTAALKAAYEASPKGRIQLGPGTFTFTPGSGVGAISLKDGFELRGAGETATKLKCKQKPGAGARFLQITEEGRYTFTDLTLEGPESFTAGDEISAIAHSGVDNTTVYCERVRFYRLHVGIRVFEGKKQTVELHGCEVDGGNIGLASGPDKQINVYGVLGGTISPVIAENCVFRRGGSNETGGTNQAHQIYVAHETPVQIINCRFYEHIAGRYIQFNGEVAGAPTPEKQLIYGCYFGKLQVSNIATHSSHYQTTFRDCVWDVEGTALEIKGPTTLGGGCQFRGGAGNSGQYIQFSTSTSLVVEPGVIFKGAPEQHIYSSGNNVDILIDGAVFEGACKTPMLITGGTTSVIRLRDMKVTLATSGNFFDTFSGTIALLDVQGCDFNGTGTRAFYLETGSTVTLLRTSGNYFHGNSNAIVKSGTVGTEISKGNRGYEDVSFGTVASGTTITLPESVDVVEVTGVAEIKTIEKPSKGRRVSLIFASTAKIIEGGNAKFAAAPGANNGLTITTNGTSWFKV